LKVPALLTVAVASVALLEDEALKVEAARILKVPVPTISEAPLVTALLNVAPDWLLKTPLTIKSLPLPMLMLTVPALFQVAPVLIVTMSEIVETPEVLKLPVPLKVPPDGLKVTIELNPFDAQTPEDIVIWLISAIAFVVKVPPLRFNEPEIFVAPATVRLPFVLILSVSATSSAAMVPAAVSSVTVGLAEIRSMMTN